MSRPRILLVEDDQDTLQVFAEMLREHFAVWVARDGTHALEVAEELGWDADLLLVDLGLGEGPRGDQFVRYYRTRAKRVTPVIVISALPGARDLGDDARATKVLAKPVDLDELERLCRLLTASDGA